jgi:hypothetical protein
MPYLSDERLEYLRSEGVGGDGDHGTRTVQRMRGTAPSLRWSYC